MPTNKERVSVQMTVEQLARFNALLGDLKRRRQIPQTMSVNQLVLKLGLEGADLAEKELKAASPPPRRGR